LVSTLPVYLNGLAGRGVHVVTVNDYLAAFHAEWMGRIYNWLGLSVGLVQPNTRHISEVKKASYARDITYGTNTEFGFDYLLDNLARSKDDMAQRGHVYAIVDEVDSILIDEARTPLIISGSSMEAAKLYYQFAGIVRGLTRDVDYEVDEEKRTVAPTEEGIEKVERSMGVDNLYDLAQANLVHQLQNGLKAKELYKRDKDYVVLDGAVKIVDEFTGRILEGRRWSDGLHQAVEAKERVRIEEENHTVATVTLQNYFRLYEKLAGMTGTAETEASEFANTYNLPVVPIPTHRDMIREDHADLIYKTEAAKFDAVVDDLVERFDKGQPVLVGTASVEKSELLSRLLDKKGIPHAVLNAKQSASGSEHAKEANIVAQAGRLHSVTVATNMAGRGVDILLGGSPEGLAAREAYAEGLEPESEEFQARYHQLVAKYDVECKAEGDKVRELGGLYVLGSERHESRRIDNQLRGRSGRQGDPGESRFYLSLEDELMRLFATGAMSWVMGKALPDDVPIEAKMVSRAIERAQNTVEARNAEIRKDVLKYDEVMNEQRKVIYKRRMQILEGDDLRAETLEILAGALQNLVERACPNEYSEDWDIEALLTEARLYYPTAFTVDELAGAASTDEIYEGLLAEAIGHYENRERELDKFDPGMMRNIEREIMLQIIDLKWQEHLSEMDYLREGINLRAMGQQDPLVAWQREAFEMFGQMIDGVDDDYVKYVMHAQVRIEQEPQNEGLQPGEAPVLPQPAASAPSGPPPALDRAQFIAADDVVHSTAGLQQQAAAVAAASGDEQAAQHLAAEEGVPNSPLVKAEHEKVGRNDPCYCGSGKKFKHCHGS
ncbi:MAG: preprotein translocase subunit SecA, partial [Actinomycetota bacterium]|nr:preprotein translocase subunit SecA [Actinomycetota bacterium]